MATVGGTSRAEESSQPGELLEGLPLISPQPDKISAFNNLSLGVVLDIVVLVVGDIAPIRIEEPLRDTGVGTIPPTSDRVSITIIDTGSRSIPLIQLAMDNLEELSV